MTKREKANRALNDEFRDLLPAAFMEEFGIEVETEMHGMLTLNPRLVTSRVDGAPLREEHKLFLKAYEAGYHQAWAVASEALE